MDAQLKRGLLEACVLAVLRKGESYGYRLIKDLSACIVVSESTLYPILKRLETAGCVAVRDVPHNGRLRRMYALTPAGQARLDAFLRDWQDVMGVYAFIKEASL